MNVSDYLEYLALSVLGLVPTQSPEFADKNILTNDLRNVTRQRVVEHATWYSGDSDALFNLYKVDNMVEFPTEPYYWANRRRYFWSGATKDGEDLKCTHCGFAKDMVDTCVLVMGNPMVRVGGDEIGSKQFVAGIDADKLLQDICEENSFGSMYRRKQVPYTLVEGWGAYKITWNVGLYGKDPVIHYYRAENVKVYRRAGRMFGITFFDWYRTADGHRLLVAETRAKAKDGTWYSRIDRFSEVGDSMQILSEGTEEQGWRNMPCAFATPCSFYDDPIHGNEGKSVYEGKLDMLDDLDQAFSIASGTVRGGMPTWTYDLDYCERDPKTRQPKLPKTFTKKFVTVQGQRNALGEKEASKPIEVVQPDLNISMYDEHILELKRSICGGFLSPATLGLDVDKKDHSKDDTVRDVSVTLFTRNHMCEEEGKILKSLFQQVMVAKEFLMSGKVSKMPEDWDVRISFDEFSDKSYEAKVSALSSVLVNDGISPKMYVRKVYGNSISEEERQTEIQWIEENHKNRTQDAGMGDGPFGGDMGMEDGSEEPEAPAVLGGGDEAPDA